MTVKEMWLDAEAEFTRLTGKHLQNGPTKSLEDVQAAIELRSKPGADAPVADGEVDNKKLKDAGLKVLKCLKMLVGAATQLSSLVRCFGFARSQAVRRVSVDADRCAAAYPIRSSSEHMRQRLDHGSGYPTGDQGPQRCYQ